MRIPYEIEYKYKDKTNIYIIKTSHKIMKAKTKPGAIRLFNKSAKEDNVIVVEILNIKSLLDEGQKMLF